MAGDRLQQLGAQYELTPAAVDGLGRLLELLAAASQAPTTVTDPGRAVDIHVADSLSGLRVSAVRRAGTIADLGSGAGFPALVLAIALPQARVTAVESVARKCAFIGEIASELGLPNLDLACARAEDWAEGREANDVVCARAVAPLGVLCEYAAPLLILGGVLVAWKGRLESDELEVATRAAGELGLAPPVIEPVAPYPGSEHRRLAVVAKRSATPERFPRRTGVALKRPLGALARPTA